MQNDNQKTLQAYNDHIQEYVEGTVLVLSEPKKDWINKGLAGVDKSAVVLELGSGAGEDANYIESLGFKVLRTDAAEGFVELQQSKGHEAMVLDLLNDPIAESYSAVYANAVLLHFDRDQAKAVLKKVYDALEDDGVFLFSVKEGEGEEWSDAKLGSDRYFCYWQQEDITRLTKEAGFSSVELDLYKPESRTFTWLHLTARK